MVEFDSPMGAHGDHKLNMSRNMLSITKEFCEFYSKNYDPEMARGTLRKEGK